MNYALLLLASIARIFAPFSLTPVTASCVFAGSSIKNPILAILVPVFLIIGGDIFVCQVIYKGEYSWFQPYTWLAFAVVALLSTLTSRRFTDAGIFVTTSSKLKRLLPTALGASVIFFLLSNLGVWVSSNHLSATCRSTYAGCLIDALPFFPKALAADLIWTTVLVILFDQLQSWSRSNNEAVRSSSSHLS